MSLKKIIQTLKKNKTFLISTHENADPDALSCELALAEALKRLGKKVYVVNAEAVPVRLRFLPRTNLVRTPKHYKRIAYDVAVIVDCGDLNRVGRVQKLIQQDKTLINIDHHVTNDYFGNLNFVKPQASSTAEMLFDLLQEAKFPLTKTIAILLYSGIMTDTGSFRYDSTTSHTHAVVARLLRFKFSVTKLYQQLYESVPSKDLRMFTKVVSNFDSLHQGKVACIALHRKIKNKFSTDFDLRDKIFTFLKTIKEIDVIVIFTEHGKNLTKVNLRSQGKTDVARLASFFDGGGHKRASGCMIKGSIPTARRKLLARLKEVL